jgi:CYTH domain-containing protein
MGAPRRLTATVSSMGSPFETEYRYEVVGDSWREQVDSSASIVQGWLLHGDGVQVRVRVRGDVGTVTCKISDAALGDATRVEIEDQVPLELARLLLNRCPLQIAKMRHTLEFEGSLYEIDEYGPAQKNLVIVEVESSTAPRRHPSWVGRELTGLDQWSNLGLAIRSAANPGLSGESRS